jgi:hypothetical protein
MTVEFDDSAPISKPPCVSTKLTIALGTSATIRRLRYRYASGCGPDTTVLSGFLFVVRERRIWRGFAAKGQKSLSRLISCIYSPLDNLETVGDTNGSSAAISIAEDLPLATIRSGRPFILETCRLSAAAGMFLNARSIPPGRVG